MEEIVLDEECMEEKKKGFHFTFGKGLIIYAGVWAIVIVTICVKLWNVMDGYQQNYDAAAQRTNPDILMPDIVEMYSPANIIETAGEEWCAGISEYESQDAIKAVLTNAVSDKTLEYHRNETFTDRKPVYDITADGVPVGLVRLKQEQASDNYGFHLCTLDSAQVLIEQPELISIRIITNLGDMVRINGKELSSAFQVEQIALDSSMAKEAAEYTGISPEKAVYVIDGFINTPEIEVVHEGIQQTLNQVEDGSYDAVNFADSGFVNEVRDRVLTAGEAYVNNMNQMASFANAAQYFEHGSKAYQMLQSAQSGLAWAGRPDEFQIQDAKITDLVQYDENTFTVKTCYKTHRLYREVYYDEEQSFEWLYVNKNGTWLVRDFSLAK